MMDPTELRSLHHDLNRLAHRIDDLREHVDEAHLGPAARSARPHVVILGGSFAGIAAAQKIRRYAGDAVEITVIDRKSYLLFVPNILAEILADRNPALHLHMPIAPALAQDDIRFILGEVEEIDVDRCLVRFSPGERPGSPHRRIRYDYLVIAVGNRLAYDAIRGFAAHGHAVTDTLNADRLRHFLHHRYQGGPILIGSARFHQGTRPDVSLPTAAAACEGPVLELMFSLDGWLRRRGMPGADRIAVFTPGRVLAEDAGPQAARTLLQMLERRGYRYFPDVMDIGRITADGIDFLNGRQVEAEVKIVFPDWVPHTWLRGLPVTDDRGFVVTDRRMRNARYPNVLAVGDAAALTVPKLGWLAHVQAHVVGRQLAAEVGRPQADAGSPFSPLIDCLGMVGWGQGMFIRSNAWYGGSTQKLATGPVPFYLKSLYKAVFFQTRGRVPDWSIDLANFLALHLSFTPRWAGGSRGRSRRRTGPPGLQPPRPPDPRSAG